MTEAAPRFDGPPSAGNHFAWLRTRLALERTMMAWVRTSISLVGFGFTIVQFFEKFGGMPGVAPAAIPDAPRYVGLALIGAGVLGLGFSLWQYSAFTRYLWGDEFRALAGTGKGVAASYLPVIAMILLLIGVFAFVAVLTRAV